jgi:hypothetical protein
MQNFIYRVLNAKILLTNLIYWRKSNVCVTISMQNNDTKIFSISQKAISCDPVIECDDCISIVGGSENVEATNITCGTDHGIRSVSQTCFAPNQCLNSSNSTNMMHEYYVVGFYFNNLIITYLDIILFTALKV